MVNSRYCRCDRAGSLVTARRRPPTARGFPNFQVAFVPRVFPPPSGTRGSRSPANASPLQNASRFVQFRTLLSPLHLHRSSWVSNRASSALPLRLWSFPPSGCVARGIGRSPPPWWALSHSHHAWEHVERGRACRVERASVWGSVGTCPVAGTRDRRRPEAARVARGRWTRSFDVLRLRALPTRFPFA